MDKDKNYLELKKLCQELGLDLFGVADVSLIKNEFMFAPGLLDKFDRAVSLAARLSNGILEDIEKAPTKLYFHHYRALNAFLDQSALRVSNYIQKKGYLTLPIPASQIIDWQKQRAQLSHKKIGYLAGLGWLGRNNLLVNKVLGSRFRLVSILTDMPLEPDKPVKENCETCRLCVTICPAQAIKESPLDFERAKCLEKLKDFQKQRLVDQYICGLCVKACESRKG